MAAIFVSSRSLATGDSAQCIGLVSLGIAIGSFMDGLVRGMAYPAGWLDAFCPQRFQGHLQPCVEACRGRVPQTAGDARH